MIGIGMAEKVCGKRPFSLPPRATSACGCLLRSAIRSTNLALAVLIAAGNTQAAEPIVGDAFVIDGDTIEIAGERIHLSGVDAPEDWQVCRDESGSDYRCGVESAQALDGFLSASRPTRCDFVGRDRYGRFIGACFRADGEDVNRWLVETGNAVERENHSEGLYTAAQAIAQAAGLGIWRGQPRGEPTRRGRETEPKTDPNAAPVYPSP